MRSNIAAIEWPPVSIGVAGALAALVEQHDQSQWLAAEEIVARQYRQLRSLADYAVQHSAAFRARLSSAGLQPADLVTPDGLRALPVLTRRNLQQSAGSLFCDGVPDGHAPVGHATTSGSTGEPVVVRRTAVNQLDWWAFTLREHLWHSRDFGERMCAVRANLNSIIRRNDWGQPANLLFHTGPSLGLPITTAVHRQLELIEEFAPASLLIYPNALDALAKLIRDERHPIPSIQHLRTVGETLSPRIREEAQQTFGARLNDVYSSQEVGYIAIECPDTSNYHVMAEALLIEVLDGRGKPCAPGEIGRITITDLHNFATPIVRYDIGDYAEVGAPCGCGRGLPTLARILGRERNLIVMPDGSRHWPLVGFAQYRELAPVVQYQFVQEDRTRVTVRLVVERGLTSEEESRLREHMQQALGYAFQIDFEYLPDAIPKGANGKFEEFVCRV